MTFVTNSWPNFYLVMCILVSVKCRLQTRGKTQTEGKMQTADCRPGVKWGKIQNGQHINKGKMHRITISSGRCGKLGSTKWGVQELEVDDIMFD